MFPFGHPRDIWSRILLTALLTMLSIPAAAGSAWEQEKVTDDGIVVFSRKTIGTTVREVLAKMTIAAPAKVVFDAVMHPKTFKKTTKKYVEKHQTYHVSDPNIWYVYQLLDLPVISNRDYCLRYEKIINPQKGVYILNWHTSDKYGPPPQDGVIRLTNIKGTIEITAIDQGKVSKVRYTMLVDPGGNIPDWLINFANRRSLPSMLRQIQDASLENAKKK